MSVVTGSLLLAAPVAVAAGALSFVSPCVLPLVPGYLSYVTGMSGADVARAGPAGRTAPTATRLARRLPSRTTQGATLFVTGFTVVFVAYGALFGGIGRALIDHQQGLQRALGALTIVLGLAFAGLLGRVPVLQREFRLHRLPAAGLLGAPLLGALFALGWTPCIGPTLATVLALAESDSTATAGRGALLTAFYCLGLGVPFVGVAIGFHRAMGVLSVFRRHAQVVMLSGGLLLVVIGALELTGTWAGWVNDLRSTTSGFTPGL